MISWGSPLKREVISYSFLSIWERRLNSWRCLRQKAARTSPRLADCGRCLVRRVLVVTDWLSGLLKLSQIRGYKTVTNMVLNLFLPGCFHLHESRGFEFFIYFGRVGGWFVQEVPRDKRRKFPQWVFLWVLEGAGCSFLSHQLQNF